ncbi:MAG: hypothetical protein GX484_18205 [Chloroflexi bacterium]|nr:hypothetical protein [Chloroflexota bacterium]
MRRLILALIGALTALTLSAAGVTPAAARPADQFGRPVLPNARQYGTEHFLIHYTFSGPAAIDPTDADGSGVPDYVEIVSETLEHVWRVQIDEMGWPPPASDALVDGDDRLDVYLDEVLEEGYAGYVDTEGGYIGDNPRTPQIERRAAFAFMVLDDDYAEVDHAAGETPIGLMQATVAHEFNHVIQAGIDDRDLHAWLYEAAATWMEDEVYDDINDGVHYLPSVFDNPDICLVAQYARGDDLHWYGSWLRLRLMSERYGRDVVRTIWENMRQYSGFGAIDAALAEYGTTLTEQSRDFAVANLLRAYEEGDLYPVVRVEGETGVGRYVPVDGVQSLGADYIRLTGSGPVTATLDTRGAPLFMRAVGVRGAEADVMDMSGTSVTVDLNAYQDVYLIVNNDEQIAHEDECAFANYAVEVAPASGGLTAVAAVWPAERFISPSDAPAVASSGGSASYRPPDAPFAGQTQDYASSPEDLNVPFDTLIPAYLPAGYEFDYAYIMTDEDFGSNAPFYVPGGGETANFDYLDGQGNWLSIAESPSPYVTVEEWIDDIGYYNAPGEIQQIAGVDVLVENLSEGADVWISATLILDGLFIVVDGDHSEADVRVLIEALVEAAGGIAPPPANEPDDRPAQPQAEATARAASGGLATPDEDYEPEMVEDWTVGLLAGAAGMGLIALCCLLALVPVVIGAVVILRRRNRQQ